MASSARRRTRVVLGLAVLLALLAGGALWLVDSSLVAVERVRVTGAAGPQAREIERALVAEGRGMSTLRVRDDALRRAVASFPAVRGVRAEADFPHELRVRVLARRPVAVVQAAGGGLTPVAADGVLLRGSPTRGLALVGAGRAQAGGRTVRGPARDAVAVVAAAPRALRARTARVHGSARGLTATMRDGPKLVFGGPRRLRAKWAAAAQVLAHASSRGAAYLDVRIPERPVAGGLPARADPQA